MQCNKSLTKIGFSLSKQQAKWLGVNYQTILTDFPLKFEEIYNQKISKTVRIGTYWNEIEKKENIFDFSELKNILDYCNKLNYEVILTVGMKAPRWPEFYIPDFYKNNYSNKIIKSNSLVGEKILKFIEKTISVTKNYQNISVIQVENEALDISGPENLQISPQLLQKEIDLIKNIDYSKRIMITFWGNTFNFRNSFKKIEKLNNIDIVGLDIYPKVPFWKFYSGSFLTKKYISNLANKLKNKNITLALAELQAEPWENFDYRKLPNKVKSINKNLLIKSLNKYLIEDFEFILLWGAEYQYSILT